MWIGRLLLLGLVSSVRPGADAELLGLPPEASVIAAYYLWYGTPQLDGDWRHWNHEARSGSALRLQLVPQPQAIVMNVQVLPHWAPATREQYPHSMRFQPPGDLHSPFYPLRGPYSSSDPGLLREHMRELRQAGVGAVMASWWGPEWRQGTTDTQGVSTDALLPRLLEAAASEGVRVAFHLEPYVGRSAQTIREDVEHLMRLHGSSDALLRIDGRAVYFVYDSYHILPEDWAQLLTPGGNASIRGTPLDGVFIGLWLDAGDGEHRLAPAGFDGAYTYFASEAVSYGANPANWPLLAEWARRHGKLFLPSVGPGYDDSKIRPWNKAASRSREAGTRYRWWWEAALAAQPPGVTLTSYNEWGEGTQIEPAKVFPAGAAYESYGSVAGQDEWLFMNLTQEYSNSLQQQKQQPVGQAGQQQQQQQGPGAEHVEL